MTDETSLCLHRTSSRKLDFFNHLKYLGPQIEEIFFDLTSFCQYPFVFLYRHREN